MRRLLRLFSRPTLTIAITALGNDLILPSTSYGQQLNNPEQELKQAQDDLENLSNRVRNTRTLAGQSGLARQQSTIDMSLDSAIAAQSEKDHVRAIRELQHYLNETQIPETQKYLSAQKILGDSYQAMGYGGKSLRAFRRYLATFLTSKSEKYGELVEVLKKMNSIAVADIKKNKAELAQLLSSITALSLPHEVRAEILYWCARSAAIMNEPALASSWFARAREGTKDAVLKSRSLYFAALIAISNRDLDTADQSLSEALQIDIDSKSQDGDTIRLALARIASERGLFKRAQEFYLQIPEGSHQYREALYDLVYVNVRLSKFQDAAKLARAYVDKYRESRHGIEVANLLGYLSLHEENFQESNEHLAKSENRLNETRNWIRRLLSGPTTLNMQQLQELSLKTSGIVRPSNLVLEAIEKFGNIAEQKQRNEDLRAEIRNNTITIGSSRVYEINPIWMNTAKSLETTIRDILEVGHRISATERELYKEKLTKSDLYRLESLESRRREVISGRTELRWTIDQYRNWINNQIVLSRVTRSFTRLFDLKLKLVSSEYASSIRGNQSLNTEDFTRLKAIKEKIDSYSKSMGTMSVKLSEQNIADFANQSNHQSARRLLAQFSNLLHEESIILERYRDDTQQNTLRFVAIEADESWQKWRSVSKSAYEQLYRLDTEIKQNVSSMVAGIKTLLDKNARISAELNGEQIRLERLLGQSSQFLLSHYDSQVVNHLTRIRKWKGDLEALKFQKMQNAGMNLSAKLDLEREMARSSYEATLQRGY